MKPYFYSERPLNLRSCRLASIANATALATHNESVYWDSGRPRGAGGRLAQLKVGWAAFIKTGDSNGIPDQPDVLPISRAMFPHLPTPLVKKAPLARVWDWLRNGYAVSISLELAAVPSTDALRRYCNGVPHQVVLYIDDVLRDICPMKPQSETYRGHKVQWRSVVKAAQAVKDSNGKAFCEVYKIDGWTAEALMKDKLAGQLDEQARTIQRVRDQRDEQMGIAKDQKAHIAGLRQEVYALNGQLAECRADKCDAEVEALLDELAAWEAEKRLALV